MWSQFLKHALGSGRHTFLLERQRKTNQDRLGLAALAWRIACFCRWDFQHQISQSWAFQLAPSSFSIEIPKSSRFPGILGWFRFNPRSGKQRSPMPSKAYSDSGFLFFHFVLKREARGTFSFHFVVAVKFKNPFSFSFFSKKSVNVNTSSPRTKNGIFHHIHYFFDRTFT